MKLVPRSLAGLGLALALLPAGCERDEPAPAQVPAHPAQAAVAEVPVEPPVEAREIAVPGDLPVFIVRGPGGACPRMVFLHGMCGHGLGYIQSFQFAAHDHGGVLALQGDVACGGSGVFRKYSFDVATHDARIRNALSACGGEAEDLVVIGYSQGASVAERLAERWPARYSRVVLLGAPRTPSVARLGRVRGAVMVSGEHDARYRMKEGASGLAAAKIPATYLEMPGARHGQMTEAERVMREAFDWLAAHAKTSPP